ncbi:MAG: hypothetical protein JNK40_11840 [Chromatiales bacterium]|nr:hypothetical protein [Chromatiales bacterium]
MLKPVLAATGCYVAGDLLFSRLLDPLGLGYLHAFLAMFAGMLVGGYLAGRGFVPVALAINLAFSALTYLAVSQMRGQPLLELIGGQHPMISLGSFAGAALGAWLGMRLRRVGQGPNAGSPAS